VRARLPPARTRGSRARRPVASKAAADGTAAVPAAAAMCDRECAVRGGRAHARRARRARAGRTRAARGHRPGPARAGPCGHRPGPARARRGVWWGQSHAVGAPGVQSPRVRRRATSLHTLQALRALARIKVPGGPNLAAHSQAVPPSRLRATPWLGATPPSQRPRGPPRCRRTSHDACSAALCNRARPLARATPAADEERCRGGARTTSGVVRRTFALGASSFWRKWRPHAHHFSADSLFHGLPMCSVFRSNQKATSTTKG